MVAAVVAAVAAAAAAAVVVDQVVHQARTAAGRIHSPPAPTLAVGRAMAQVHLKPMATDTPAAPLSPTQLEDHRRRGASILMRCLLRPLPSSQVSGSSQSSHTHTDTLTTGEKMERIARAT